MNYLPIFQELFESDSVIFMLIGVIAALLISIKMNNIRRTMIGLISCFVLYAVCELVSNVHTNFMIELILLFVGTIAIGGMTGFFISAIVTKVRKQE